MEPETYDEAARRLKQEYAPDADESCTHCGLWKVKVMDSVHEYWMCAIDTDHRFCQGRCSKYEPKWRIWNIVKNWFSSKLLRLRRSASHGTGDR